MSNDWEDQEGSISDPHSAREEDEGSQTTAAGQQASGSDPPGNKKSRTERSWLPENWWKPSLFHSKSQPSGRDAKYYKSLSLQDKRALYTCGRKFVTMSSIDPWSEQCRKAPKKKLFSRLKPSREIVENEELNKKVSWWKGDITCLEIDAIVNAANRSLLGGGGVDGAIHSAAGYSLRDECAELNGCDTGDAKITSGHRLPAKYIIHTVGSVNCNREMLKSCYDRCLQLVLKHDIKTVAFCCIATGVDGYANEEVAHIALSTIREWLETADNASQIDRIIFCVFLNTDVQIYHNLLYEYFPPVDTESHEQEAEEQVQASHQRTVQHLEQQLLQANREVEQLRREASAHDIEPWKVARAKVELGDEIARGGWGSVSEGKVRVAIKQLHIAIANQRNIQRLRREMRILSQIRHPNLVQFIGAVFDEQAESLQAPPLIITELLDTNLRSAYERNSLTSDQKLSIFKDVAKALNYLHKRHDPIIHRDVSAPNVLLEALPGGSWKGKLTDLGSANFARVAQTLGEGAIIYAAPETIPKIYNPDMPTPPQTFKIDVFSFGVMLCEVTTNRFPDQNEYGDMLRQVRSTCPPMYSLIEVCTKEKQEERPVMTDILRLLDNMHDLP